MNKLSFFVICLLLSVHAYAFSAVTKDGYVACLKKEWLEDVVSFVSAKDKASFQSYIDSQKCIAIKGGLRVTVTESPGMFGRTAEFVYKGVKLWTIREGLDYGK